MDEAKARLIREANDEFRRNPHPQKGRVVVTAGIRFLGNEFFHKVWKAIQEFDDFDNDIDPHREHDMVVVTIDQQKVFWKVDYFSGPDMLTGAEDPSDPSIYRCATLMLDSEY